MLPDASQRICSQQGNPSKRRVLSPGRRECASKAAPFAIVSRRATAPQTRCGTRNHRRSAMRVLATFTAPNPTRILAR